MSIDMYLNHSDLQAETTRTVLRNQIAAYEELQTSLNQFVLASPTLSGKTYDSAKAYSSQILLPLIRACILYDEAVIAATEELPERYREEVDVIDLKEWELLDYIDRADSLIERYRELIRQESWKDLPNYDYLNSLSQTITNYENTKSLLEAKLQKLMEFNWSSANIFNHVHDLYYAVQEGMRQATSSWNGESQTFTLPPQEKMTWATDTNARWLQSERGMEELILRVENGGKLSDNELKTLGNYIINKPYSALYERGIPVLRAEVDKRIIVKGDDLEFLKDFFSTSIEETSMHYISNLDDSIPSLDKYWSASLTGTPYFRNVNMSFDSAGYGQALSASLTNSTIKHFTVSQLDIPILGTSFSMGISGISSVFIGLDFVNNLTEENVGRAFTHTLATTTMTTMGVAAINTGITTAAAAGSGLAVGASAFIASNPIGWGIGLGLAVGFVAGLAYNSNFLGLKDMANLAGDAINDGLEDIGQSFDSGIKSIQKVFGW